MRVLIICLMLLTVSAKAQYNYDKEHPKYAKFKLKHPKIARVGLQIRLGIVQAAYPIGGIVCRVFGVPQPVMTGVAFILPRQPSAK